MYNIMTTNIAKSMSTKLKDARSEPIITLIIFIQKILVQWFLERRNKMRNHTTTSITEAMDVILKKHRKNTSSLYMSTYISLRFTGAI